MGYVIIFTTCGTVKEARGIAGILLKKRLVACATITPSVESKFWWKGKVDRARECLVMLKARKGNFKKIENEIARLHRYEVPEIIAVPIVAGSREYLAWIDESAKLQRKVQNVFPPLADPPCASREAERF
jgi:periplasmic divalent cation tolerance protein